MKQISNIGLLVIASIFIITGCDKTKPYDVKEADAVAHFVSPAKYVSYFVRNVTTDSFSVQIGTSDVSSLDRTVGFNISSPSGAVSGTNYTITSPASGNNIIIKAGTAITAIKLHGNFASYSSGRKDTLVFTLARPSIDIAKFSDTVKVILQRYCDVVPASFVNKYTKCFDIQDGAVVWGPYNIKITTSVFTSTGATTGYVMMANFFDVGGPEIKVKLDWTNPANFTTTIVDPQFLYKDPTYGDATISGVGTGSFSSCDNTFKISYKVTVAAGSFGNFTTTLAL